MKKEYKIILYFVGIVIVLFILNFLGVFSFLNQPINKIVAGEPNKSCSVDTDCKWRVARCEPAKYCGEAVNKNWVPVCPFRSLSMTTCASERNLACINNQCQEIKQEVVNINSDSDNKILAEEGININIQHTNALTNEDVISMTIYLNQGASGLSNYNNLRIKALEVKNNEATLSITNKEENNKIIILKIGDEVTVFGSLFKLKSVELDSLLTAAIQITNLPE